MGHRCENVRIRLINDKMEWAKGHTQDRYCYEGSVFCSTFEVSIFLSEKNILFVNVKRKFYH